MFNYYIRLLGYPNIPEFLKKYLTLTSIVRLKEIGYFCGMDYASKDVYNFKKYISRYNHVLSTALLVYKLTNDKVYTLQALFHDISTPVFSHVIDYMNKDYLHQESTEEFTEFIISSDSILKRYLEIDNIDINSIINYKQSSIVDNDRPKLCADRLDGVILNGSYWINNLSKFDISRIVKYSRVYLNEDNELEIGFNNLDTLKIVVETNNLTDIEMHKDYDNYMMDSLANIVRYLIDKKYIAYEDLYFYTERKLFSKINKIDDKELIDKLYLFRNIKKCDIPKYNKEDIKVRSLHPLLNGKRCL